MNEELQSTSFYRGTKPILIAFSEKNDSFTLSYDQSHWIKDILLPQRPCCLSLDTARFFTERRDDV